MRLADVVEWPPIPYGNSALFLLILLFGDHTILLECSVDPLLYGIICLSH
jgi:hypothetical protein